MTHLQLLFSLPGGLEWIIIFLVIGGLIFWIKIIIEIATSNFSDKDAKIVWLLITILLGFFGALIYFFAGRHRRLT